MKLLTVITLIIALSGQKSFSQDIKCPECKQLLDTTIAIMKSNAVNSQKVNWNHVSTEAYELSKNAKSPYELGHVFSYLFKSINDFHGAFFYGDSTFKWNHNEPLVNDSIQAQFFKGAKIKTGILEGRVGYLRIPSMSAFSKEDFNVKAQKLNDSLCYLLSKNIKGLIIDLRLDGGGAMHPMILGVEQLIKQGKIGSFYTKKKEDWFIKGNTFFVDTVSLANIAPKCNIDASNIPVVIITSSVTGSAAECFIIAFRGRPNTILLVTTTAGYVTVNNGFQINENAGINLSIGYSADRTGKMYKKAFNPDITMNSPDNFLIIENDKKIKSALNWLNPKIK